MAKFFNSIKGFIFSASAILLLLAGAGTPVYSQQCTLNLPQNAITMEVTVNEYKPCNQLRGVAPPGYLWAHLSGIGPGYSVADGLNPGYCGDLFGVVEDNPLYGPVTYQAKLWSSLDPGAPKLINNPPYSYTIPWNEINYLINMYPVPNDNYTWLEIQAAIWELVHGCNPIGPLFDCPPGIVYPYYFPFGSSGAGPYGCPPDGIVNISEVNQIVLDANANGGNFIPDPSEKIAVVVQILSCEGNTVAGACDPPYQIVFIPVQCPTPGIAVTKECTDASAVGQPINFSAVITNTGDETLNNITCTDDKAGTLNVPVPSLAPGASTTVTGSYVPTTSPSTDTVTCSGTGAISNKSVSNSGSATCKVPPSANCVAITAVQGNPITPVTMTASGGAGGPYTFSAIGLPAGLTMSSSGTISGTPTVSGTFNYTVTIKDSAGNTGTVNCSVTVNPPITANCVFINAVQGVAITPVTMTASGGVGGPYTFSATGLPAGLTMSSSGTISGTPTVSGTFNYTVTIKDSVGNTGTVNCSVTVNPPITANCVFINAVHGVAITPVTMTASGGAGGPYSFSATGLPTGLTMSSSGTISGTPTVSGTFNYTVTIKDSAGNIGTVNCSVTVNPPITANCVVINAVRGVAITPVAMTASGGAGGPYSFSATGLPTGLTMSSSGTISGTPTVSGTFNYTVTIKDSAGNTGTVNCSVTVNPVKPDITIVKTADKQTVLSGEKVTYTYKITNSGNLALTNVKVVDNNGTSTYTSDDFTVGTIASLAPGASQTFTSTRVPPAPMCGGGSGDGCGLLVTEHRNDGKTKFTFLQSKDGRDNYWTFNNWYGSRAYSHKAKIRVYNNNGNTFQEVDGTLGNGDGFKYFNSFSCLADKSTVVKSDGCSVNLPDIFYKKGWNKDWHLDWDQSRGDYNRYHCWDDDYEGYNVSWDYWEHPDTCSGTSTNTATVTASWSGGTISATDDATVNLTAKATSKVSITKTANKYQAAPGEAVTYTYVITNTGGGSLTNLMVVDDNGTPTITEDDFTVGTVALLDPSKSTTLTKTLVPAAPVCGGSSGCGLMITQHLNNGTTKFTFLQSKDERDTYWTFSGWEGTRSYAHRSKMRVYDKTGWTYQDFDSTPSAGAGSNYFNSFSVVVNTSSVVKSDGCSVNLPTVFYKKGWNNDWRYDWDKWVGDYNRTHYWDDDYSGHSLGWDYNTHPYCCSGTVTNTAKVTATGETATVTASDDATVKIVK